MLFAVRTEASAFLSVASDKPRPPVLFTGMGARNAHRALEHYVSNHPQPSWIISSGFAGGLNPDLVRGSVLFETDKDFPHLQRLDHASAIPGRFHTVDRVLITAQEKAAVREQTGADAVEMESGAILRWSRQRGIPAAILRVISDAAADDLPLDFNRLMTPDLRISPLQLTKALVSSPARILSLIQFQRQVQAASRQLSAVLWRTLNA